MHKLVSCLETKKETHLEDEDRIYNALLYEDRIYNALLIYHRLSQKLSRC